MPRMPRTLVRRMATALPAFALAAAVGAAIPGAFAQTACATAWNATTAYTGGQSASQSGVNYTANWWTQGNSPATNNGGSGSGQPWTSKGTCTTGSGGTGSGGGSGSGGGATTPPPPPGAHLFAPYADISLAVGETLASQQMQAGFKAVTLAFLDATSGCAVGWGGLGGSLPTDNFPNGTTVLSMVQQLQGAGVQVILSFGGANGQDPAGNCGSPAALQAVYQQAIDRYHVKLLDFDIEGGATTNQAAITQRDKALVGLKAANAGLVISYTLPVLPTGLIASGVGILNSVKADGLALDTVNVMAMDYGSAQDNNGAMGLDATYAAAATYKQLQTAGLSTTSIGVTPMIGVNDTSTEVFQLNDAQTLLNFAASHSYITRIAMWSMARDNGGCAKQTWASPTCSGLAQNAFQFTSNFNAFK